MPGKLIDLDEFRAAVRDGGSAPDATVFRFTDTSPLAIAAGKFPTEIAVHIGATCG